MKQLSNKKKRTHNRNGAGDKLARKRRKLANAREDALQKASNEIVKKDLSVRIHSCNNCGLEMDRDLNAALNIRERLDLI